MQDDMDAMKSMGRRMKILCLLALVILVLTMTLGKTSWRFRSVPVDPDATAQVMAYIQRTGGNLESVKFRDQQGRCGYVSYSTSGAPGFGFSRYLVDDQVHMDTYGLVRSFEEAWEASPCYMPPRRNVRPRD